MTVLVVFVRAGLFSCNPLSLGALSVYMKSALTCPKKIMWA